MIFDKAGRGARPIVDLGGQGGGGGLDPHFWLTLYMDISSLSFLHLLLIGNLQETHGSFNF